MTANYIYFTISVHLCELIKMRRRVCLNLNNHNMIKVPCMASHLVITDYIMSSHVQRNPMRKGEERASLMYIAQRYQCCVDISTS